MSEPVSGAPEERFTRFVAVAEPRLRRALVAWYGVDVGSEATADAMAYAWERWDALEAMKNPTGYLFRVGQSSSRRYRRRHVALPPVPAEEAGLIDARLPMSLARLSPRQRAAVLLVHAHGWTYAEAADALGCNVSTLRNHLARGLRRLRLDLGDDNA